MPRPRFTLRVMLIIVAATAGWLGMKVYREEQQKREHSRALRFSNQSRGATGSFD